MQSSETLRTMIITEWIFQYSEYHSLLSQAWKKCLSFNDWVLDWHLFGCCSKRMLLLLVAPSPGVGINIRLGYFKVTKSLKSAELIWSRWLLVHKNSVWKFCVSYALIFDKCLTNLPRASVSKGGRNVGDVMNDTNYRQTISTDVAFKNMHVENNSSGS